MKNKKWYEAKREAVELENAIGTEEIDVVREFYLFHPDKNAGSNKLAGTFIYGTLSDAMEEGTVEIPTFLQKEAIKSGLVLYSYLNKTAYVLSRTAVTDLFEYMGVSGRMIKLPFIERDLYLSSFMYYYKGFYKDPLNAVCRTVTDKVKYVIAFRGKRFQINPCFEVMNAVETVISQTPFRVVDYDMKTAVHMELAVKNPGEQVVPTIIVHDSVDGNSSLTVTAGYRVGKTISVVMEDMKISHRTKTIDWETFQNHLLDLSARLLEAKKQWEQKEEVPYKFDVSGLWGKAEKAAAMKKNKRAATKKVVSEAQANRTTWGEYQDMFFDMVDRFDYTNDVLEHTLGDIWKEMLSELGIPEEVSENASS